MCRVYSKRFEYMKSNFHVQPRKIEIDANEWQFT